MQTPTSSKVYVSTSDTTPNQRTHSRYHPSTPVIRQRSTTPSTRGHHTLSTVQHHSPSPIINPFETDYEHLQHFVVTPGIFKRTEKVTPDTKAKPFQWDIEHEARLNPVDFGDVTEKLKRQEKHCRETDQLAQPAADKFFETEQIVPSPWSEPLPKVNLLAKIDEEDKPSSETRRNVSCQTDIHVPLSVNFDEIFKEYKLSNSQIEELNKGESFSNSSLRRKLFDNECSQSSNDTPEKEIPLSQDCWNSPPLGELCASSPMFGRSLARTIRRCSLTELKASSSRDASPDLSPISSPVKYQVSCSKGLVKSSPDIKEGLCNLQAGFSFSLQDEFQLSNCGLLADSDSEADNKCPELMSVDGNTSSLPPTGAAIAQHQVIKSDMESLLSNQSVSMMSIGDKDMDNSLQTETRSVSDTGYQTASLYITDTFVIPDLKSSVRFNAQKPVPMSPERCSQTWEPRVASTPNKSLANSL